MANNHNIRFAHWYGTGRAKVYARQGDMFTDLEIKTAHQYYKLSHEIMAASMADDTQAQAEIAEREVLHPMVDSEYYDMSSDARDLYARNMLAKQEREEVAQAKQGLSHVIENWIQKIFR